MQNDLISRSALKKAFEAAGFGDHSLIESVLAAGVYAGIENAPTIDAVPVVRCKDCVCSSMSNGRLICSRIAETTDRYFRGKAEIVMPDDFCSRGVRQKAKPCGAKMDGGAENG